MATGKFLNVKNSSIRNNKLYMFFPYEKHRLQFPCHQSLMMRCCDVICSWLKNNIVWFNKIDLIYSVQDQFKHEQRSMWCDCGQRTHLSLCIFAKVNINFFHLLIKSSGKMENGLFMQRLIGDKQRLFETFLIEYLIWSNFWAAIESQTWIRYNISY